MAEAEEHGDREHQEPEWGGEPLCQVHVQGGGHEAGSAKEGKYRQRGDPGTSGSLRGDEGVEGEGSAMGGW